ncbi:piggyBac transposable element-derived protein 4-like [Leptopilina boulardi]|uniref:piggyBac transposable element-derived protein 4-like n=1 Tax=Leptopilina boulardi TaxID=63433 RepID=UPI0021F623C0|nr:piggyBac transposable element-derived protein 4-like [Leptopilina boulardi]
MEIQMINLLIFRISLHYTIIWTENVRNFTTELSFEREPEIAVETNKKFKEIDYFNLFFYENILKAIVQQSNLHRSQKQGIGKYDYDLTFTELQAWIGMIILMGIHRLPRIENYWSTDPALRVDFIAKIMPRDTFRKITEILHINDNNNNNLPKTQPNYDKLFKLRPLIDHLHEKIKVLYTPSKTLSVDESMLKFKGRSSLKQYMPQKPIKRSYKVWCLADSKTSYIANFEVYTGKCNDNQSNDTLGERVVIKLTRELQGTFSLVAYDNFFTSVNLVEELRNTGIYSVGTVRTNRKGLPEMMKEKKLQRREYEFKTTNNVTAIKWMYSKIVTVLSSAHNPLTISTVKRTLKTGEKIVVSCQIAVAVYNSIMGGVVGFDQRK